MIQDISPAQFHNEYRTAAPAEGDTVFVFQGQKVLAHPDGNRFPVVSDLPQGPELRYLFRIDARKFYLHLLDAPAPTP